MKIIVFASGRGSNFEALIKASQKFNSYNIVGLICDKECPAMDIARKNNIPVSLINAKDANSIITAVKNYSPDYIFLAGYMRIIPSEFIDAYPLRVVNIHPSLLPAFTGKDAILQAWNAKVKTTGVTIHYVNDKLDNGPIIKQKQISVPERTLPDGLQRLETKIHETEHELYPLVAHELSSTPFDTLLISRCLLGENVRYDGGNKYSNRAETAFKNFKGNKVKVCPEIEAGFPTPRDPITDENREVLKEVEVASKKFIEKKLNTSKKILAILKDRSPSCGVKSGQGVFTSMLYNKFGEDVLIVSEEEL
ncbi:MAG: phosphoribosylglycinamide formyltransferase [Pseudomonadota bacterium]